MVEQAAYRTACTECMGRTVLMCAELAGCQPNQAAAALLAPCPQGLAALPATDPREYQIAAGSTGIWSHTLRPETFTAPLNYQCVAHCAPVRLCWFGTCKQALRLALLNSPDPSCLLAVLRHHV